MAGPYSQNLTKPKIYDNRVIPKKADSPGNNKYLSLKKAGYLSETQNIQKQAPSVAYGSNLGGS